MLQTCKFTQRKLINPVVFASVFPSIRSTDIKLQEVQRNMSKVAGCFIKLLSHLPNILKTNGDHNNEKLEAIQTILDGIKMSEHATQNLVSIRKNSYYLVLAVNTRIQLSLLRTPSHKNPPRFNRDKPSKLINKLVRFNRLKPKKLSRMS